MSTEINDGGPAFPMGYHPDGNSTDHQGMTLRDWMAAHATDADIDNHRDYQLCPETRMVVPCRTREQAKYAYADAMIAAREVKP